MTTARPCFDDAIAFWRELLRSRGQPGRLTRIFAEDARVPGADGTLNRLVLILVATLVAALVPAAAETPAVQPGEWMITSKTVLNGAATQPTSRARCLTPQQTADIATTFGPQMGTVNSTCAPPKLETTARTLTWQIECRGQMDMNVQGSFEFDSPSHYTATVSSKAWMAGALVSDVKTEIQGEHVGKCRQ